MLICAKDCFDSAHAIYYKKGQTYERGEIADSRLMQHFTDQDSFQKEQKENMEREIKSVSSVRDVRGEVLREVKSRKKLQEVNE